MMICIVCFEETKLNKWKGREICKRCVAEAKEKPYVGSVKATLAMTSDFNKKDKLKELNDMMAKDLTPSPKKSRLKKLLELYTRRRNKNEN